jgi:hypothetical protein
MGVDAQIETYIAGLPRPKGGELRALHQRVLVIAPDAKRWFLDGKNDGERVVANPNIGYGICSALAARSMFAPAAQRCTLGARGASVMAIFCRNFFRRP